MPKQEVDEARGRFGNDWEQDALLGDPRQLKRIFERSNNGRQLGGKQLIRSHAAYLDRDCCRLVVMAVVKILLS
jgi:hypothetical protein